MLGDNLAAFVARFSGALGGPFYDALVRWPGVPTLDDGGSITSPGIPDEAECQCQVDSATEAMRAEAGYREKDVALILIGLSALDTDATVEVVAGPSPGVYSVQSVGRDAIGSHWLARGRLCR